MEELNFFNVLDVFLRSELIVFVGDIWEVRRTFV